jgi:hypothetical protein
VRFDRAAACCDEVAAARKAGCDGAERLELGEAALDQVALGGEVLVERVLFAGAEVSRALWILLRDARFAGSSG